MLKRLKRFLQAAVGDLVERAGDPELELARFVEEVEMSLGEVRAERQDYSKDSAWCSRLKGRGIECKDPVTKVGDKLGIGPTEGQIAFVVQLQEKISQ